MACCLTVPSRPAEHRANVLVPFSCRLSHLVSRFRLILQLQALKLLPHSLLQLPQLLRILDRTLSAKTLLALDRMLVVVVVLPLRNLLAARLLNGLLQLLIPEAMLRYTLHGSSAEPCDLLYGARDDGGYKHGRLEARGVRGGVHTVLLLILLLCSGVLKWGGGGEAGRWREGATALDGRADLRR